MPGLSSLASGLKSVTNVRTSDVYLTELGADGRPIAPNGAVATREGIVQPTHRFQYFPESISDTKAINYQTKEVPGGSLPLYQYVNSGERMISFTAQFTTDVDHFQNAGGAAAGAVKDAVAALGVAAAEGSTLLTELDAVDAMYERLKGNAVLDRNVFIPAALLWLRRFMFPRYGDGVEGTTDIGTPFTFPPRKILLTIPGSQIHRNGGGGTFADAGIVVLMTQCDITYEAFFPSGNPRIVSVSLAFAQTPQLGGSVSFPRHDAGMDQMVNRFYGGPFVPGNSKTGII